MFKSEQLVLMNLSDKDRKISYQTQKKILYVQFSFRV